MGALWAANVQCMRVEGFYSSLYHTYTVSQLNYQIEIQGEIVSSGYIGGVIYGVPWAQQTKSHITVLLMQAYFTSGSTDITMKL